jgi:outer membrane protein OmpA-like peptidoglycan-associated protein
MTSTAQHAGATAAGRARMFVSIAAAATFLSSCASTPDRIEELEAARAAVTKVESSQRAGLAATHVAAARKALERADALADQGGNSEEIQFEAGVARINAQIANEKILATQARDEIEAGRSERQAVLIEAREREAERRTQEAQLAAQEALHARQRTETLEQELADLKAKRTARGVVVTLGDVLFDTARATLKPGAYGTMDRLAAVLREVPERRVVIEGHTDSVGSEEYNEVLSERRAAAVQAALFERGVAPSKMSTVARGESMPVASNADPGGRQQNRRVELIVQEGDAGDSGIDELDAS